MKTLYFLALQFTFILIALYFHLQCHEWSAMPIQFPLWWAWSYIYSEYCNFVMSMEPVLVNISLAHTHQWQVHTSLDNRSYVPFLCFQSAFNNWSSCLCFDCKVGQRWPKSSPLMTSLAENPQIFFEWKLQDLLLLLSL